MKRIAKTVLAATVVALAHPTVLLAQSNASPDNWHAKSLMEALLLTGLFGIFGVILAIFGYKLFDWCTPGQLHKEIVENKNIAAAIVGAAVILGVCIIIAAAIMG